MSYIRLHYPAPETGVITSYDITTFWDVSIDPQAVSGANYYAQEGRTATFTMPYDTIWEIFTGNPNKPIVYRALVEIYETFDLIDQDNLPYPYERKLFTGYLCRDSFVTDTIGEGASGLRKIITVRLYDYVSILIKDPPYQTITLQPEMTYNIQAELARLWEMQPYSSSTSSILPLWTRPPLAYEVEDTPGYGVTLNNYSAWAQSIGGTLAAPDIWYNYVRVYEDGFVYLESLQLGANAYSTDDSYYCRFLKYRVIGTRLILLVDQLTTETHPTAYWVNLYGNFTAWTEQHYVETTAGLTYSLGITDLEGSVDTSYNGYTLYVSGQVVVTELRTLPGEAIEVGYLEWLQYLLNIQYAYLHDGFGDNVWRASNKAYFSQMPTTELNTDLRVTAYREEYDTATDTMSAEYEWLENSTQFMDAINNYMRDDNIANYCKVSQFNMNQLVGIGARVRLSQYNPATIAITSLGYDMANPFLYSYTGRSR